MPLIDETYFVGELNIPKASEEETLNIFIEKYEKQFLREVLGHETYNAFITGLAASDQIWLDLRDGATYTYAGMGYQWEDLKQAIACYVYFHWMRNETSSTTQIGESKPQAQNAVNASSVHKMVRAWNEMVDIVWNMWWYLDSSLTTYTTWKVSYPSYYTRTNFRKINSLGI
jgi:hypothetical protein